MKILVIDDNKEITEAISFYFESVDISSVITNNGRDGLQMIKDRNDFDLILLDIAMPEFTGLDIINELKNDNLLSSKNIVFFTASNINEEELMSQGAKGIIRKPISIEELQHAIEKFSVK
jgi:two-component system OmpR family response regulator